MEEDEEEKLHVPYLSESVKLTPDQIKYLEVLNTKEITLKKATVSLPCGWGKSLMILSQIMVDWGMRIAEGTEPTLIIAPITVGNTFMYEIETKFGGELRLIQIASNHSKKRIMNMHIDKAHVVIIGFDMLSTVYNDSIKYRKELFERKRRELLIEHETSEIKDKLAILNAWILSPPKLGQPIPAPFEDLRKFEQKERFDFGHKTLYFRHFRRIVVDEAHEGRRIDASYCEAISCLSADIRITMSGTPINNSIHEITSILKMMQCEEYSEGMRLTEEIVKQVREKYFIIPPPEVYHKKKSTYETKHIIFHLDFDTQLERDYYNSVREKAIKSKTSDKPGAIFTSVSELRQACDAKYPKEILLPTKIKAVIRYIEQIVIARKEKAVIFSNYIEPITLLVNTCNRIFKHRGSKLIFSVFEITGKVVVEERKRIMDEFFACRHSAVLICTQNTIGVGVNLECANHVIKLHPWWNPQIGKQAEDRVNRITQKKSTFIVDCIMKNTIEEDIACVASKKEEINTNFLLGDIDKSMFKHIKSSDLIDQQLSKYSEKGSDVSPSELLSIFNREHITQSIQAVIHKADITIIDAEDFSSLIPETKPLAGYQPVSVTPRYPSSFSLSKSFDAYNRSPLPSSSSSSSSSLIFPESAYSPKRCRTSFSNSPVPVILEPEDKDLPPIPEPDTFEHRDIKIIPLEHAPAASSSNYFSSPSSFLESSFANILSLNSPSSSSQN